MNARIKKISMQILPILKKAGVVRSGIFGSFARGEETVDSDLDILVELKKGKTYFDLAGLQEDLEGALGRKIDIGTYGSIHPAIKERVLKEEERIL
jgi:predicted nucleotidyltransferase